MANITISNVCNLSCPYCFAATQMDASCKLKPKFIDLATFEKRLDFLDRSGIDQIRLIGGEPTLHPNFPALIQRARRRGKKLLVYSHGLIPEPALRCLEGIPEDSCLVLLNMNATRLEDGPNHHEMAWRERTTRRLGQRAIPGFNIYQSNFKIESILQLIQTTGCRRTIRLGLAQPILDGANAYLHPRYYPEVGRRIKNYAQLAAPQGITLELDCGFVRCMFSDEDLHIMHQAGTDVGWRCNPILDISLDGRAIHCFPLTGQWQIPLKNGAHAADVRRQLSLRAQPYRLAGIYKACSTCGHKRAGNCQGGCLAHTLRRFRHHPFQLVLSAYHVGVL